MCDLTLFFYQLKHWGQGLRDDSLGIAFAEFGPDFGSSELTQNPTP